MTSSLVADGIKIIRGNRVIINNFSSKLRSSDIVAMVGRNGAGKSTIMSALTGHLIPTEGKIHVLSDKKGKMTTYLLRLPSYHKAVPSIRVLR